MAEETLLTDEKTEATTEAPKTLTDDTLDKSTDQGTDAKGDETATDKTPEKEDEGKAPVEYSDFTFPEGYEADKDMLGEFTPLAQKYGITQEDAQGLVDLYVKSQQAAIDTFQKTVEDWRAASESDKEFGGKALKENLAHAQKVLGKYGTPALKEYLNVYGAGNHPEVLRFLVKVGKAMAEDTIETGGNPKGEVRDIAKVFFPNMN